MNIYEATHTAVVNGKPLHYAEAGAGHPVVLLHGNGEDHHLFDLLMDQLARAGYRVIAPDSPGHGANGPLPEYHYAEMAEDIYGLIRALGVERPALYGHSDGGVLGLLIASRHPQALSALAASGANLAPEGLLPSFLEDCRRQIAWGPNPLITMMLTEPDIDPESLKAISIPVLLTAGENDLVLRSETEKIAAAIPGSRMVILEGHDHSSYIRDSTIMGEMLIGFFAEARRIPGSGSGAEDGSESSASGDKH